MKPLPPLKTLVPFHAVATQLSFSRAAEELHVSHSAISQSIKQLEDFLQTKLFERDTNISLTKTGEKYFEKIDQALRLIQTATHNLTHANKTTIRVNMLASYAMHWLIPKIQGFQEQHPEYELKLCSEWRHTDFAQEDVDLALYYGDGNWPDLICHKVFNEELVILGKPGTDQVATIDDLSSDTQFLYVNAKLREDNFTLYCKALGLQEPKETDRIYFQNTLQCLQAAMHGTGLVAANKNFLTEEINNDLLNQVVTEAIDTGNAFYLVYPSTSQQHPKIQAFTQWLLSKRGQVIA